MSRASRERRSVTATATRAVGRDLQVAVVGNRSDGIPAVAAAIEPDQTRQDRPGAPTARTPRASNGRHHEQTQERTAHAAVIIADFMPDSVDRI